MGISPPETVGPALVTVVMPVGLTKMGSVDDLEAVLHMFERVSMAASWSAEQGPFC